MNIDGATAVIYAELGFSAHPWPRGLFFFQGPSACACSRIEARPSKVAASMGPSRVDTSQHTKGQHVREVLPDQR